jgi:hypothetical protein
MIFPTAYFAPEAREPEAYRCDTCRTPMADDDATYNRVCDRDTPFECLDCNEEHVRGCRTCVEG